MQRYDVTVWDTGDYKEPDMWTKASGSHTITATSAERAARQVAGTEVKGSFRKTEGRKDRGWLFLHPNYNVVYEVVPLGDQHYSPGGRIDPGIVKIDTYAEEVLSGRSEYERRRIGSHH